MYMYMQVQYFSSEGAEYMLEVLHVFGGSPSGGNGHHCGSRKIGTEGKGQRAGTHIPGLHGMEYAEHWNGV